MTNTVRILHVDDEPGFADLTAEFLEREREDFDVVTEQSATEAHSRLATEDIDCIVSDYQMPHTDGLAFLETVREDYPDLPFILFTNQGSEQVAAKAIETGVTSYLQKETGGTVQYAILANRIQNHVEKYRAQRRARTARQEYELAAKTATDVFWTVELPDETVTFGAGLGHFGYDADTLDNETGLDRFCNRVHPDDRKRIQEQYEGLLARDESAFDEVQADSGEFSNQLRFERADGTYADCRGRGIVLFEDGKPDKIVGTMTDVSEQTERERELEETTRELEAIIEASPDAIVLVDEDGIARQWNPAAERLFGWTAAEVVGEPLPAVPPEEEPAVNEIRERLLGEDPDPITGYETKRQRKDGSLVDVSVSTAPVRDSRDDVIGTVAVVEDISDRKAAERDRQRERDRLHALFENTPDPIMEVEFEDGTPLIDAVNPAFERTFGVDAGSAVGRTVAEIVVPDEQLDEHERLRDRVFQGEPVETEVRRETASGVREFALRIIPVDVGDVSSGAYAWYTDITERKNRHEAILSVLNELPAGILVESPDREILTVNEQFCDLFSIPDPESVTGADCERAATNVADSAANGEQCITRINALIENREPVYNEPIELSDGHVLERSYIPVELPEGPGNLWMYQDVTERRERERELERVMERFRAFTEHASDLVTVVDEEGVFQYHSPSVEGILGYAQEELVGESALEYIHPDDRDRVWETFVEMIEHPEVVTRKTEFRFEHADGSWVWLESVTSNETETTIDGYVVTSRDVTERRERERELRRVKERFQRVFEHSNDAIMIVDLDCEAFVEVNPAACEMLGYARDELLALDPEAIHPDDIDRVREEFLSDVYETGTGWTDDITCVTKNGEEIPTEISGAKLQLDTETDTDDEDGESLKMVAVLRDISEQVAYERELERQAGELERQNERLEKFVDTVSHDLRNPLNVATGRLSLATEECDSEHLDPVADALDRMETLMEDLLTLARQGEAPAEIETVDLADVVETSWQNVDTREATLRLDAERSVRADRSRLMQLFENLVRNAVEHGSTSPGSHARQDAGRASSSEPSVADAPEDAVEHGGEDVTVTVGTFEDGFYVADDGPGIDPDDREQVFDSGYSTTTDGTGFGLSIVEEIVDAHGWSIRVTESESGGARFEITDCTALE